MAGVEERTKQRVVRRSFTFVTLPVIVLGLLTLNLIYEIIRINVGMPRASSWPLRFSLLDRATTATLLGVLSGLFLARLQWSKANRPTLAYSIMDEAEKFSAQSDRWAVFVHNGGPGIAIVEDFSYVIKFAREVRSAPATLNEINHTMEARGLVDGVDYSIREQGAGAVYAPVAKSTDGNLICWFTTKALAQLEELDIILRVKDSLGDSYERTLEVYGKLPSVAVKALEKYLRKER